MSKVFKAVTKAVTSVVKAVVNVVSSVVKAVVNVVSDVINFIASPFMGLMGMPNIPDAAAEAQRQDGVLLTKQGGGAVAIPIVYGYRRLGSVITFCETGSTNNKYLWVAYTFCEGPVEGLNEIFIDDTQLSVEVVRGLNSGQIIDVPDAKYKGRVQLQWFPGVFFADPSQSQVGTISILKDAPSWKPSMAYNGLAVLMARYEYKTATTQAEADANPFSGSIPQVQISLLGKKVASLRTGAGTENYSYQGSGYTERYSTNPAEILLDYLRNPRYGKGLVNTDIDWDSFYVAAQKCNQEIPYTSGVVGPILTMNIVVDTNQTLFASVKNILVNFRAYLPYVQGKYKLKIEDAGNATNILSGAADIAAVFNRDSIVGEITYTGIERTAKYNQVVVTYVDPDQKFSTQQVVYPESEAERQVYIGFDGGRENKSEITMSGITNQQIARDFARLIFNKSRFQESCSLTVSAEGFNLEPGDNIYINSNILNFGTVPWRVVSSKLTNNYTFELGCVRNPDFIYPYVVPNTPDTVIAPYIPKGASILPPLTGGESLIGLVPPVTAPLLLPINNVPVTPISTATNPPTTVTTGTNGGGVGGSSGTINTGGGSSSPNPPPPPALVDVVTIDRVDYNKVTNEVVDATIYFVQPQNAMYNGLQVYYRQKFPDGPWVELRVNTVSSPGSTINFTLKNLIYRTTTAQYELRTRVSYSSGENSTLIGKATLDLGFVLGRSLTTENPADSTESSGTGWPTAAGGVTASDNYFQPVSGVAIRSGGSLTTPRSVRITMAQNLSKSANGDIIGVKVLYKPTANLYWNVKDIDFGPTYVAGASVTFDITENLGVPGSAVNYDFIFRARYRNGTVSTTQTYRPLASIEQAAGIEIFQGYSFYGETSSARSVTTVQEAVSSGALANAIDMEIGIAGAIRNPTTNVLRMWIYAPDASVEGSWSGIRIYTRPVVEGSNPAYVSKDYVRSNTNKGVWQQPDSSSRTAWTFDISSLDYTKENQFLIVPLVQSGFSQVEGTKAWFGQGFIGTDPNGVVDWVPRLSMRLGLNSQLKGSLTEGFQPSATNPTAIISAWEVYQTNVSGSGALLGGVITPAQAGVSTFSGTANAQYIQTYYRITVNVTDIANFNEIYIYRRQNKGVQNTTNFYGVGRYDRLIFNTTSPTYNSGSKTFTIKLKLPSSVDEYSKTATNTSFAKPNSFNQGPTNSNVVYVNPPLASPNDEFYVVVTSNSSLSNKALKITGLEAKTVSYINILSKLPPPAEVSWPLTENSQFTAGWGKTVAEARTASANSSTTLANFTSSATPTPCQTMFFAGQNILAYVSGTDNLGIY